VSVLAPGCLVAASDSVGLDGVRSPRDSAFASATDSAIASAVSSPSSSKVVYTFSISCSCAARSSAFRPEACEVLRAVELHQSLYFLRGTPRLVRLFPCLLAVVPDMACFAGFSCMVLIMRVRGPVGMGLHILLTFLQYGAYEDAGGVRLMRSETEQQKGKRWSRSWRWIMRSETEQQN
jgi:hypothetical protein